MDFRLLEYFLAVAKTGNITKAAGTASHHPANHQPTTDRAGGYAGRYAVHSRKTANHTH